MKTVYKVTLTNGEETYVLADNILAASKTAEKVFDRHCLTPKTHHIMVIASEGSRELSSRLVIAEPIIPLHDEG